ncbi:MAG: thiamine pyrophosphate-dependent dehydrogenase E1 component subunit alpha [Myxococcota bacterium]
MTTVTKDGLHRILGQRGEVLAKASVPAGLEPDTLRTLFRWMLQQRLLDDLMLTVQRQGRIGFYGPATGQEAAVFGTGLATEPRDWVLPALREGGVALMRGYPLVDYLAQCFGNSLDKSFGRQMPCHYGAAEQNYATLSSPIGNQLPQAVGVAMAMKARGTDAVSVGYIGDGGTSEGDFHTALDMAQRMKAPVVFVCQNNQWAISTPVMGQTASASIAAKAKAFRMPNVRVDGNDVLACYEVTKAAVDRARAGEGPSFIEALTYRIGAHSTSDDPSRYRDESITEKWKKRCPIARFQGFLVSAGYMTEAEIEALGDELGLSIRETLSQVESAPKAPPLSSMFEDVFAEQTWFLREQAAEAERYGVPKIH